MSLLTQSCTLSVVPRRPSVFSSSSFPWSRHLPSSTNFPFLACVSARSIVSPPLPPSPSTATSPPPRHGPLSKPPAISPSNTHRNDPDIKDQDLRIKFPPKRITATPATPAVPSKSRSTRQPVRPTFPIPQSSPTLPDIASETILRSPSPPLNDLKTLDLLILNQSQPVLESSLPSRPESRSPFNSKPDLPPALDVPQRRPSLSDALIETYIASTPIQKPLALNPDHLIHRHASSSSTTCLSQLNDMNKVLSHLIQHLAQLPPISDSTPEPATALARLIIVGFSEKLDRIFNSGPDHLRFRDLCLEERPLRELNRQLYEVFFRTGEWKDAERLMKLRDELDAKWLSPQEASKVSKARNARFLRHRSRQAEAVAKKSSSLPPDESSRPTPLTQIASGFVPNLPPATHVLHHDTTPSKDLLKTFIALTPIHKPLTASPGHLISRLASSSTEESLFSQLDNTYKLLDHLIQHLSQLSSIPTRLPSDPPPEPASALARAIILESAQEIDRIINHVDPGRFGDLGHKELPLRSLNGQLFKVFRLTGEWEDAERVMELLGQLDARWLSYKEAAKEYTYKSTHLLQQRETQLAMVVEKITSLPPDVSPRPAVDFVLSILPSRSNKNIASTIVLLSHHLVGLACTASIASPSPTPPPASSTEPIAPPPNQPPSPNSREALDCFMRLHESVSNIPSLRHNAIDVGFIDAFVDLGSVELALSVWEEAVEVAVLAEKRPPSLLFRTFCKRVSGLLTSRLDIVQSAWDCIPSSARTEPLWEVYILALAELGEDKLAARVFRDGFAADQKFSPKALPRMGKLLDSKIGGDRKGGVDSVRRLGRCAGRAGRIAEESEGLTYEGRDRPPHHR